MQKNNYVSIIMPTYNRGYIISNAIESVISQTYKFWELIIVDDGSTDNTKEVLDKYKYDKRIHVHYMPENRGANYCRNYGINESKYEYLAFIDSDAVWNEKKLYIQMDKVVHSDENVNINFCKTKIHYCDKSIEFPDENIIDYLFEQRLKTTNLIDTNTLLVKKNILVKVGGFDEKLCRLQEWELLIRIIIKEKHSVDFIGMTLCDNYIQNNSITMDDSRFYTAMKYIISKHKDLYLNNNVFQFVSDNRRNYIFGAGLYGNCLMDILIECGYKVNGFVVSQKENDTSNNVCELAEIDKKDGIIVGVGKLLEEELKDILVDNGYDNWILGYNW